MPECANTGCTDEPAVQVVFTDPDEVVAYCELCGVHEYRQNRTAHAVIDISSEVEAYVDDPDEPITSDVSAHYYDATPDPPDDDDGHPPIGLGHVTTPMPDIRDEDDTSRLELVNGSSIEFTVDADTIEEADVDVPSDVLSGEIAVTLEHDVAEWMAAMSNEEDST